VHPGEAAELRAVLPQWSSELLRADALVPAGPSTATLTLSGSKGTLRIDGELPIPIQAGFVVYGSHVATLTRVPTGEPIPIAFDDTRRQIWYDQDVMCLEPSDNPHDQVRSYACHWGGFFSFRRDHERVRRRRGLPAFDARLDLTRHLQEGAAYLIGAVTKDTAAHAVSLDGRWIAREKSEPSVTFMRYRLDVQRGDSPGGDATP